ncbi:sister chromatid cohesion 1 protein 4 [Physcomitrium patens]|uniref:Uncharacterized protein n=1 Tax=Physcomitrium patens TaxID=3218 RepID=A0A2K1KE70_PHYPA|nr:sister chromatid cohesion 1 protein 4-like [Physcomitrium patens]PNR52039.1 hypothetical protein PHYPA_008413 [Physcomitrium patens]|eukprot:XP_024378145.1 sister chromatid cohesion 1 protein 4-like [Physcomitrella patens]
MFYSQLILAKKGPLGTIWIAAHLERKLRKNQVTETNISVSVDSILFPEAPIALRLSGHLLLGVVRIYSRKVNYLFHDCSEALTKIKQAFHAGAVDLPPESSTAPFHAITLPENFDLDEFEPLAERESVLLASGATDQHVTTRELITLQDQMEENIYFGSQFDLDERLPQADLPRIGLDFEEEEREKEARERERSPRLSLEEEVAPAVEEYRIDFDRLDQMEAMDMEQLQPMTPAHPSVVGVEEELVERPVEQAEELEQLAPVTEVPEQLGPVDVEMELEEEPRAVEAEVRVGSAAEMEEEVSRPMEVEGQGEAGEEVVEVPDELVPALEGAAEELPRVVSPPRLGLEAEEVPEVETLRSAVDAPTEQATDLFAFERETARSSRDVSARDTVEPMEQPLEVAEIAEELREASVEAIPGLTSPRRRPSLDLPRDDDVLATLLGARATPSLRVMATPSEEAPARRVRRGPKAVGKKRKLVLDAATVLHGDVMRQQLANSSDIRRVRKIAPCTRSELWIVHRQTIGQQIFSEPSVPGVSNALRVLYDRVLVTGAADLPSAGREREVTPEANREDVPATPGAAAPVEEPDTAERSTAGEQPEDERAAGAEPAGELVEEPGLELAVVEPVMDAVAEFPPEAGEDLTAAVDTRLESEVRPEETAELAEGSVPTEEGVEFPMLETEPGIVSEPPVPESGPTAEPILLLESEAQEEAEVKEEVLAEAASEELVAMEEDVEIVGEAAAGIESELLHKVAAEAEAVAEAVAGGEAVVVEGVDGRTIIVLEDDGTIIDEGPSSLVGVKEEVVGEEIQEEELGFLGEPRETVFLQDVDDDLHEEAESYDDSVQDVTLQGFGGWSARTRAVGGYLQGVFAGLAGGAEIREKEQSPKIGLDYTLRGKTRKEAARLFFETLVLKTKDYVDVEQPQPYGEIYISAQPKLMKASF